MKARKGHKYHILAGALLGALAAFFVAVIGHLTLWFQSSEWSLSTGATQGVDQWTYFSMARAVWRSPNGITYSYPYSLYWPVPPVLFQLPITALAWLGRLTGLPLAFETGRIAGAAGTGATLAAIGLLFPRGFWRRWFYLAAVLGGGLFSLAAMAMAIETAGLPGLTEPHQYQPKAQGQLFWWLPFLAQNLRMPLECLYHAMVVGALACLAWRRYWWAWALGAAAWVSNPFTAVALHCAVVPWLAWRTMETRGRVRRQFALYLAMWLVVNALAAAYYGWYLNRWPLLEELARLYQSVHVPALEWWRLALLILPYGSGLLFSVIHPGLRRAVWGRPVWRLFALLGLVHIVLLQQSLFLGEKSMQSFHYNRGYLHLGLVVVAWRVLVVVLHHHRCINHHEAMHTWWPNQLQSRRCRRAAYAICAVVVVSMLDQAFFTAYALSRRDSAGIIEADYAALVKRIPVTPAPALVLTETGMKGSYVTAFSPHISWDADETMVVPYSQWRVQWLLEALAGDHGGVAGLGIDYALVYQNNEERTSALRQQGWRTLAEAQYLKLLQAPEVRAGANPDLPESLRSAISSSQH